MREFDALEVPGQEIPASASDSLVPSGRSAWHEDGAVAFLFFSSVGHLEGGGEASSALLSAPLIGRTPAWKIDIRALNPTPVFR